jgi:hypothetical protein
MRNSFHRAKRETDKDKLQKLAKEEHVVPFSFEHLRALLISKLGREVILAIAQQYPDVGEKLSSYMSRMDVDKVQDLSVEHLRAMEAENGFASELWGLLCDEVDIATLVEVISGTTDPSPLIDALSRLKERGVHVLPIARSEARVLTFPMSHPQDGYLYIGHPGVPHLYYPAAQFHRLTFEHKVSEAIRILQSLGATELEIEHVTGWKGKVSLGVEISNLFTGEGHANKGSESKILYKATLDGTRNPTLPDNVVWYLHEPTWQHIAEGRLYHGLRSFALEVRYEEDFGINVSLGAKLREATDLFNTSGQIERLENTVWRIIGAFGEPAADHSAVGQRTYMGSTP